MTTIAFADARADVLAGVNAPSMVSARSRGTRLRLTPRGRRVVSALIAAPVAVAIAAAVLGGGAATASNEQGAPLGTFETVTVMAGESLWNIAQEVAPDADPRDVVAEIMRLNALESATVGAGASIAIPAQYTDGQ